MSDSALCRSQSRIRLTERSVEYSRAFGRLTVDTGIDVPRSTALILEPSGSFEDIHGVADADAAPAVLGPGRRPGHHHVGPEPGHRDRLVTIGGEPVAELTERAGA